MPNQEETPVASSPETEQEPVEEVAEDASSEIECIAAERDRALEERRELFEKFQRAQAEFENARKRLQREQEDAREYAAMSTIEGLLPIVDDFERALDADGVDPEYRKGLELIHSRILEVFERTGLRVVDEEGTFDPNLHQAVDRAPAESDEDDQKILDVYRRGYLFKDRLLRPAMVKVAVKE